MKKAQKSKLLFHLNELVPEVTNHGSGTKFVFRGNKDMHHASTQVAYGKFKSGEFCEEHAHPTMFEYFFFTKGKGTYLIEGEKYDIEQNTFLEIPSSTKHSLHADKGAELEFVYWGIAID